MAKNIMIGTGVNFEKKKSLITELQEKNFSEEEISKIMSDKSIMHALEDEDVVLGGCGTNTLYNYNKNALLSAKLSGIKCTVLDDGEEYKSLCDALGVEYIVEKSTN